MTTQIGLVLVLASVTFTVSKSGSQIVILKTDLSQKSPIRNHESKIKRKKFTLKINSKEANPAYTVGA